MSKQEAHDLTNFWKGLGIGLIGGLLFSITIFTLGYYYKVTPI
jgi:hypothetical protein